MVDRRITKLLIVQILVRGSAGQLAISRTPERHLQHALLCALSFQAAQSPEAIPR